MDNRVALVTGAARGVGAAICRHFSTIGYDLLVNYNRSAEAAEKLVSDLSQKTKAKSFQGDVGNPDQVRAMFDFCQKEFGKLDVLVNNASYSSATAWNVPIDQFDWNELVKTIDVDLKGTMLCSHAAFAMMQPLGSGKIINFSSSAALQGDVPTYLYTPAKIAIVGVTRALARAFAPAVQVNCIAPGSIATDWIKHWMLTPEDLATITKDTPLKRIGKPEEVAELAALLASPTCSFITGQTIVIDGGILML
jgi:3-oxoacyl-[acyl-carrier protein] reductase